MAMGTVIERFMAQRDEALKERDAALKRVAELIDLVDELTPLIGAQYDVPELRALADDLTGDVKDESKDGGA